jgi:hypothetical protein
MLIRRDEGRSSEHADCKQPHRDRLRLPFHFVYWGSSRIVILMSQLGANACFKVRLEDAIAVSQVSSRY